MRNLVTSVMGIVKEQMQEESSGHDYWHVERVYHNAIQIMKNEEKYREINKEVVSLASLLHDIGDYKVTGSEDTLIQLPKEILEELDAEKELIEKVLIIIGEISFHQQVDKLSSIESEIVQDADRLDAIGAIGIARAFAYGGAKGRELWNPNDVPKLNMSKEEYMNNRGSSINHFYEKLLLLKEKMNTITGKKLAENRHKYMEVFLQEFFEEWKGEK